MMRNLDVLLWLLIIASVIFLGVLVNTQASEIHTLTESLENCQEVIENENELNERRTGSHILRPTGL